MFQMQRVFCATPWEMEAERMRFHDVIGRVNETAAMPVGSLYVPVTLVNVRDKRPMQYVVDENIRDCSYYIVLLADDWGPVERNFRSDYHFALECAADSTLPMQSVAVLRKNMRGAVASLVTSGGNLPEPQASFFTIEEFDECVGGLLTGWLESLAFRVAPAGG
jgi:hypothetical protein